MEIAMPTTSPLSPMLGRLRFLTILMLGAYLLINLILLALSPWPAGQPGRSRLWPSRPWCSAWST
jgi:hypothetical protein